MICCPVHIHHPKQDGEEGQGYTDYQAMDQGQGQHWGQRMELAWVNPTMTGQGGTDTLEVGASNGDTVAGCMHGLGNATVSTKPDP
eukprot:1079246-Rhodomonas_salina.1